jgi:hypothetical protein
MSTCHTPPPNRKLMIDRVGQELTRRHGKQRHYSQTQISSAASATGYPIDVHCWAYCVFMDSQSFGDYHLSIGEICNYDAMRTTMLESLGSGLGFSLPSFSWPDFDWLNIDLPSFDWPDIDLSGFFDWT